MKLQAGGMGGIPCKPMNCILTHHIVVLNFSTVIVLRCEVHGMPLSADPKCIENYENSVKYGPPYHIKNEMNMFPMCMEHM